MIWHNLHKPGFQICHSGQELGALKVAKKQPVGNVSRATTYYFKDESPASSICWQDFKRRHLLPCTTSFWKDGFFFLFQSTDPRVFQITMYSWCNRHSPQAKLYTKFYAIFFSSYKASVLSFFLHLCSVLIYDLLNCGREIPFSHRTSYSVVTHYKEWAVSSLPSPYSHTTKTRPGFSQNWWNS